jgi:2-iminobutanoate/2-iminopropanoate deaminase
VSAILNAAGSSLERVVSATVIILEETDFAGMNEEWVKWFPENPPARQGAKLPVRIPGMKVSVAAIAEA